MAETALKDPGIERMTLAAFLDWDDGSDVRFELVRGEVRAMAPTMLAHVEILANVLTELRARLPAPCRATIRGGVVDRDDSFYVPDLVVDCGPRRPDARHHESPRVIFEVLSDATGIGDRMAKLPDCRSLPSVEAIALIHTHRTHIEFWRRPRRRLVRRRPAGAGG